jgi:hypothetical protein
MLNALIARQPTYLRRTASFLRKLHRCAKNSLEKSPKRGITFRLPLVPTQGALMCSSLFQVVCRATVVGGWKIW